MSRNQSWSREMVCRRLLRFGGPGRRDFGRGANGDAGGEESAIGVGGFEVSLTVAQGLGCDYVLGEQVDVAVQVYGS